MSELLTRKGLATSLLVGSLGLFALGGCGQQNHRLLSVPETPLPQKPHTEEKPTKQQIIDITDLKKTDISYHPDGTRTYRIKPQWELMGSKIIDLCNRDNNLFSVAEIGVYGTEIYVVNDKYPQDACSDGKLEPSDFK